MFGLFTKPGNVPAPEVPTTTVLSFLPLTLTCDTGSHQETEDHCDLRVDVSSSHYPFPLLVPFSMGCLPLTACQPKSLVFPPAPPIRGHLWRLELKCPTSQCPLASPSLCRYLNLSSLWDRAAILVSKGRPLSQAFMLCPELALGRAHLQRAQEKAILGGVTHCSPPVPWGLESRHLSNKQMGEDTMGQRRTWAWGNRDARDSYHLGGSWEQAGGTAQSLDSSLRHSPPAHILSS